jgi:hypothetical protein
MHTSRPAPPRSQPRHTVRRALFSRSLVPLALCVIALLLATTALARASTTEVPPAPVILTPPNGATTTNTQPPVTGTAEASSTVTVYVDTTASGTVTADASGNWSYTIPTTLADGTHAVKARASNSSGSSVDSNTNTFTVDTTPPPAPVTVTPANGATITTTTPTVSGTAEAGSTVTVFVDTTPRGTVTSTASGAWSLTLPSALADGSHTAKARATDSAGNRSVDSNTTTFTVDTTPPQTTIFIPRITRGGDERRTATALPHRDRCGGAGVYPQAQIGSQGFMAPAKAVFDATEPILC